MSEDFVEDAVLVEVEKFSFRLPLVTGAEGRAVVALDLPEKREIICAI